MEPFHPIESQTSFFKGQELHIQYPNMKGVIYVKEVSNVTILNSQFTYNDPGFIFNDLQVVGFIESLESLHVVRASNIYISDGMEHVHIGNSFFSRNQLYYMSNLTKSHNYLVHAFFPPNYFEHSFSPIINYYTHNQGGKQDDHLHDLKVTNNTFHDHKHFEINGYAQSTNNVKHVNVAYTASLMNLYIHHQNF